MAENKTPEFEPPQACVQRVIKAVLPDNVQIGKDAKAAFSRSAGIFIMYLTACANDFCREAKRQTISAQDVMQAIKELEFGELEEPLREYLDQYRREASAKKQIKAMGGGATGASAGASAAAKKSATSAGGETEADHGDVDDHEDGDHGATGASGGDGADADDGDGATEGKGGGGAGEGRATSKATPSKDGDRNGQAEAGKASMDVIEEGATESAAQSSQPSAASGDGPAPMDEDDAGDDTPAAGGAGD